ncbi:unnamed protein product [Urochloa humidicola]
MIRRFVNLVVAEWEYGSLSYSLHRLDVANHLFYPSTAAAEAANSSDNKDCHGGGKPSMMGTTLRRLPPATTWFQQYPRPPSASDDMFVLLRASGEGRHRILHHAGAGDHCLIHDADDAGGGTTASTAPSIGVPMGPRPLAFSVPGAGGQHESRIYVMRSDMESPVYNYYPDDGVSVDFVVLDFNEHNPKWWRLPPPPFANELSLSATIGAFTVVNNGGATEICMSSENLSNIGGETTHSTYCFDTVSCEWRLAGGWKLPFEGRAEYVPELGTWLGFSPKDPNHMCAVDLSAIAAGGTATEAPKLQHVWEDFNPPPEENLSIVLNPNFPEYVLWSRDGNGSGRGGCPRVLHPMGAGVGAKFHPWV